MLKLIVFKSYKIIKTFKLLVKSNNINYNTNTNKLILHKKFKKLFIFKAII